MTARMRPVASLLSRRGGRPAYGIGDHSMRALVPVERFDRPTRWLLGGGRGVSFFEQPPSNQWAALTFRGERIAEVWFKPDGEPFALVFRIPQSSFQIPGIG